MTLDEVRKKYLDFFEKRGHAVIESASLLPKDDSTTLFTSSGMQPLLPYFLGEKHPKGVRLTNSQKCFRAEDIEEVGDNRHTTFFEMLGNFSFGDSSEPDSIGQVGYFKQEQLQWLFEFLTDEIGLDPNKLYITVFVGDEKNGIPKDTESAEIWTKLFAEKGIEAKSDEKIFYYDAEYNWWSRSGSPENMPVGEPGGSDTEVFYDFGTAHDKNFGEHCHPNCECGRFLEIGNSVFMEYIKQEDTVPALSDRQAGGRQGSFKHLPAKNVDFGGGLERITAAANNNSDIFNVDVILSVIKKIEKASGKSYDENKKAFRIIADHIRAAEFIIADGVTPSNTEQGYVLRRLIRRAVRYADKLGIKLSDISDGGSEINVEEEKFRKTLEKGMKEFNKLSDKGEISGDDAFILFTTHGFPIEMTIELAQEKNISVDKKRFKEEMKKHQELSRAGAELKFKGGLADTGKESTKYHTATHLLLQALKDVLGDSVVQKGSNINTERLRFDFSYGEKLTAEQKQKVEELVNEKIKETLGVNYEETDGRRVYTIGNKEKKYSVELCGGPHVENTSELGHFKIKKEESVSAGVRRIKAILE